MLCFLEASPRTPPMRVLQLTRPWPSHSVYELATSCSSFFSEQNELCNLCMLDLDDMGCQDYHKQMLELRQKVSPREVVVWEPRKLCIQAVQALITWIHGVYRVYLFEVGWFSTGDEINATSAVIHAFYCKKDRSKVLQTLQSCWEMELWEIWQDGAGKITSWFCDGWKRRARRTLKKCQWTQRPEYLSIS